MKIKQILFFLMLTLSSTSSAAIQKTNCQYNTNYVVLQQSAAPNPGNYFMIWRRSAAITPVKQCQTLNNPYMIIKSDPTNDTHSALWFSKLDKIYLILDNGTSTDPRYLNIYNLDQRKQIYGTSYFGPVASNNGQLTYWIEKKAAHPTACANYNKLHAEGLNVKVIEKVNLDLAILKLNHLHITRCAATQ